MPSVTSSNTIFVGIEGMLNLQDSIGMKSGRDTRTDLLRVVFMLMICNVHVYGGDSARWANWLTNLSFTGVLGFVLISGYHGIKFSWMKILKIESIAVGCALTVMTLVTIWCPSDMSAKLYFQGVLDVFKGFGYWFVHAYVVMMCFATLLGHSAGDNWREALKKFAPIFVMVYGWSFLMHVPVIWKYMPPSSGLEAYSGLTLFAAYLAGRLYRICDFDHILKLRWVISVTFVCAMIVSCVIPPTNIMAGLPARYNSPFLLGLALGVFWLFRRIQENRLLCLRGILTVLTPSLFAVYLLHSNVYGKSFIAWFWHVYSSSLGVSCIIALNAIVFVGGVLFDVPRRLLVHFLKRRFTFLQS